MASFPEPKPIDTSAEGPKPAKRSAAGVMGLMAVIFGAIALIELGLTLAFSAIPVALFAYAAWGDLGNVALFSALFVGVFFTWLMGGRVWVHVASTFAFSIMAAIAAVGTLHLGVIETFGKRKP